MAKVLVLETEPTMMKNLKAALNAAGHQVFFVTERAAVPAELSKRRFDLLLVSDSAVSGTATKLAVKTEKRGVKTLIMATTLPRLEELRAKGLICFQVPDAVEDLQAAICGRI